jgi:hypothetical protein
LDDEKDDDVDQERKSIMSELMKYKYALEKHVRAANSSPLNAGAHLS